MKDLQITKILWRQKNGDIIHPNFIIHCPTKQQQLKQLDIGIKTDTVMEQNGKLRNKTTHIWATNL